MHRTTQDLMTTLANLCEDDLRAIGLQRPQPDDGPHSSLVPALWACVDAGHPDAEPAPVIGEVHISGGVVHFYRLDDDLPTWRVMTLFQARPADGIHEYTHRHGWRIVATPKPEPVTEPEEWVPLGERSGWSAGGQCTCHASPPCGWCVERPCCDECGALAGSDQPDAEGWMSDTGGLALCGMCYVARPGLVVTP